MEIHFCTQNPCPVQDKEMADALNNGFSTFYANPIREVQDMIMNQIIDNTSRQVNPIFYEKDKEKD